MNGAQIFLKKHKTQKNTFFAHFFDTFDKNVPKDKISKSEVLLILVIFVTNRHFPLEDWKSWCEAGYRETRLRGGLLDVTLHTRGIIEPIGDLSSSIDRKIAEL